MEILLIQLELLLLLFGVLVNRIDSPQKFFESYPRKLEGAVEVVRIAFGRPDMDFGDIYDHLVSPEILFLMENQDGNIAGMAAYNACSLAGISSLIVEGIAMDPSIQARGIFRKVTDLVSSEKEIVCLRTQNPNMYRALQNYCSQIYPGANGMPLIVKSVRNDLAARLGCSIDDKGIARGYYGGLFYGKKPYHPEAGPFFENTLGMDLEKGDALLVVGLK